MPSDPATLPDGYIGQIGDSKVTAKESVFQASSASPSWFPSRDVTMDVHESTNSYAFAVADGTKLFSLRMSLSEASRAVVLCRDAPSGPYAVLRDRTMFSGSSNIAPAQIFHSLNATQTVVDPPWIKLDGTGPNSPPPSSMYASDSILGIRVVAPENFDYTLSSQQSNNFREWYSSTGEFGFLRILPPQANDYQRNTFVNVLWPAVSAGWASRPQVAPLDPNAPELGFRIFVDGTGIVFDDWVIGTPSGASVGEYRVENGNGSTFATIRRSMNGEIMRYALVGAGSFVFTEGSTERRLATVPTGGGAVEVEFSSNTANLSGANAKEGFTFWAPSTIETVNVEGTSSTFTRTGEYITIGGTGTFEEFDPRYVDDTTQISPPVIQTPINECGQMFAAVGVFVGASTTGTLRDPDGSLAGYDDINPASLTTVTYKAGPMAAGQLVQAWQSFGGAAALSAQESVVRRDPIQKPTIYGEVYECAQAIQTRQLVPGVPHKVVRLSPSQQTVAQGECPYETCNEFIAPAVAGEVYETTESVCAADFTSDPVTVTTAPSVLPTPSVNPIVEDGRWVGVNNLVVGAEVELYVNGMLADVQVTPNTNMWFYLTSPIAGGDVVHVLQRLCTTVSAMSLDVTAMSCQELPPPAVVPPHDGDVTVKLTAYVAGARVHVFERQSRAELGDSMSATVPLYRPLVQGDEIVISQALDTCPPHWQQTAVVGAGPGQ